MNLQGCVEIDNITITSPIEVESLQLITPMGRMWDGHVTPTDHQYWSIVGGLNSDHSTNKSIRVDLHSPADGLVTSIERFKQNDYRMIIQHSCSFATLYIHVAELSDKILSSVSFSDSNQHQSDRADILVKQGEIIGKVTGPSFDFSVEDTKVTLVGFISPERYDGEPWKIHTTDPFDYFSSPIREQLVEKTPRTADPIGGKIDYDVHGRLVGNWFKIGGSYQPELNDYYKNHLSVAFDHFDPSQIRISLGDFNGEPKQFGVKGNAPLPQQVSVDSSIVKYELVNYDYFVGNSHWDRITPDKNLSAKNNNDVLGVVLFEMIDDSNLKVEIFPGKITSQVTGFTDNSEMYDR